MTTNEEIQRKTFELIDGLNPWLREKVEHLLKSGLISPEDESDSYVLPKLIMCALGREIESQYAPADMTRAEKSKIKSIFRHL